MTCKDHEAKGALSALFLGELKAEHHLRLREHAATCAECHAEYDRLSRVESSLEKRVLPKGREALLEAQLLARVRASEQAAAPKRRPFWEWWKVALPAVAAAVVAVLVVLPRGNGPKPAVDEWGARNNPSETVNSAFGVRAFCVAQDKTQSEAKPGEKLACPEGAFVQFSYTAPVGARLALEATSPSGEMLKFFPREGKDAPVASAVDKLLPDSTPVQSGWLSGLLEVRARFTDEKGQTLSETRVFLTPAE